MPRRMNDDGNLTVGELFIMLFIAVVGLALYPTIQSSTNSSVSAAPAGSAAAAILPLIPLVYVIVLLGGLAAYIVFKARS